MFKLFVGGLPFSTTDDELNQAFSSYGTIVSAVVVKDRDTGRSKGFGFVEFESDDAGKAAISALNGSDMGGRSITVNEARPKEDRPRRDFGGERRQNSW